MDQAPERQVAPYRALEGKAEGHPVEKVKQLKNKKALYQVICPNNILAHPKSGAQPLAPQATTYCRPASPGSNSHQRSPPLLSRMYQGGRIVGRGRGLEG